MRKCLVLCVLMILAPALAGCGHEEREPPLFVADILSRQSADGDIAFDPVLQTFTITNGPETLFFGIDDLNPDFPEYRAFLDFPLDGSTGYDVVPARARIVSARLEIFIDTVSFASLVPTLLDLVVYPLSGLRPEDFGSPALRSRALNFFASDRGNYVSIDVTPLMQEAQRLGLTDLQVRFLLDPAAAAGWVGIEDRPGISVTAPLLTVAYTF